MQSNHALFKRAIYHILATTVFLIIAQMNCIPASSSMVKKSALPLAQGKTLAQSARPKGTIIWSGRFGSSNWQEHWRIKKEGKWGMQNAQLISDPSGIFFKVLRVSYPAGSASPTVSRLYNAPLGGTGFYADLGITPRNILRLSYYVRFSDNFNFVKGGKLPGLFGGIGNNDTNIPDGTNGFSTRLMWRTNGDGEVYAYLPTSPNYGTSISRGSWRFQPGKWYHLEQQVRLNQPGQNNGRIQVWVDGKQVVNQDNLMFRTTDQLKVNGIFFSTFFGGDDPSWATPNNVYVDFAQFSVVRLNTY